LVLGDAPRLPRVARLGLALTVISIGFICYYFRLTSALGFEIIGVGIIVLVLLGRRWWWERKKSHT
jgi:hypothetical protein